jgi:plasmid stabilization system protein ParE
MARLIWTAKCLDDLERLIEFIERDAPVAACRFAQQIIDRVESLPANPQLGSVIQEDDTRTYRELLQGNYRIIYRIGGDAIYLVAVHHAARLLGIEDLN